MLNSGVSETEKLASAIHGMQSVSPESLAAAQASVSLGETEETCFHSAKYLRPLRETEGKLSSARLTC